jgi:hypothetical protein
MPENQSVKAAVLKLGVATLLMVAKFEKKKILA